RMLCAADLAAARVQELAIVVDPAAPDTAALLQLAHRPYRPHVVLARTAPGDSEGPALTPLLRDRPMVDGRATAYVCEGFVCRLPATTPRDLAEQLGE
ncbi:MAG: thioredoxin domain-containing protein, partial [Chloroflexales bacterium]|nr:thioredoxin domain-containing protein [Chloroflexales bacterium]